MVSSFPLSPAEGRTNTAELSDREKLLLLQKHFQTFQKSNNLTPDSEETRTGTAKTIQEDILHKQRTFEVDSEKHELRQERKFPTVQPNSRIQHPEILLNQLSLTQKNRFLNQFESLSQEQQIFAYNKFLSSPEEIQVFAINQFLSLDSHTLGRAIQDEIRREGGVV